THQSFVPRILTNPTSEARDAAEDSHPRRLRSLRRPVATTPPCPPIRDISTLAGCQAFLGARHLRPVPEKGCRRFLRTGKSRLQRARRPHSPPRSCHGRRPPHPLRPPRC